MKRENDEICFLTLVDSGVYAPIVYIISNSYLYSVFINPNRFGGIPVSIIDHTSSGSVSGMHNFLSFSLNLPHTIFDI